MRNTKEPNRNKWEPLIRDAAHRIADLPMSLTGENAEIVIRDIVREVVGDCVAVMAEGVEEPNGR